MLWDMKFTAALLLLLGMLPCGCAAPQQTGTRANDFLGASAASILAAPTRVEGWNFTRPDGSIMADAPIEPLDISVARELGEILRSDQTYSEPSGSGSFQHSVGFRVWRGTEAVDVILSFGNDQMEVRYPANNGSATSAFAGVTAARDRLAKLAHKAFPEFNAQPK
jgi:hypothetical protein